MDGGTAVAPLGRADPELDDSVTIRTAFAPDAGVLRTRLSGVLSAAEVGAWAADLEQAGRAIAFAHPFRMIVDIRGYEVAEQDPGVHRLQRLVIPTFLARHGFEVGYFRLFEVENSIAAEAGLARCIAVAHVHHDAGKMALYNERLATPAEAFFTDPEEAEAWIRSAPAADAQ